MIGVDGVVDPKVPAAWRYESRSYRGLRVWAKAWPLHSGTERPAGTVQGTNGLGSAYVVWDGVPGVTLVPLNEVETYGQYVTMEGQE